MGEHPNADLARKLFEAMDSGEVAVGRSLIADDVVWHTIGGRTVEGLVQLEAAMTGGGDFSITGDVHDVVANDDHVVALINATATAGDQELTYRTAEIMHVEDGKITERWAFSDDTQAIIDFFSQFE